MFPLKCVQNRESHRAGSTPFQQPLASCGGSVTRQGGAIGNSQCTGRAQVSNLPHRNRENRAVRNRARILAQTLAHQPPEVLRKMPFQKARLQAF
jgi:hypothetical protein